MTEDNWKLLLENGVLARYEREFRVEIDGRKMSTDDKQLIVRGHEKAVNEVIRLLQRPLDESVLDEISNKATVTISEETWKLIDEYNALTDFRKGLKVDVAARRLSTGQWELTLSGPTRAVDKLCGWLPHAPRKLELVDGLSAWLCGQTPGGARVYVIMKRTNARIQISSDKRSVLLIGSPREIVAAVAMISGVHCATHQISQVLRKWLSAKTNGPNKTRSLDLEKRFDTTIIMGPHSEGDRTQMLDLTVFAERRENAERVFAQLDGLHKEYFKIESATACWLINKRKGSEDARAREFDAEFDSFLDISPDPSVDISDAFDVEILGESADGVRAYKRMIEATVVEKVNVTRLQFEYWFGHDRERARDRPHHRLEDSTDTMISRDDEAGLFHVAGRPEGVNEAMERINKTRHIKLFASEISLAMANYIATIRHEYENDDDLQIHLAYGDTRGGSAEFRRLHRMNSENDGDHALTADNDLMPKLDLHEIVLEVPAWTKYLVTECLDLEKTTATGIGFSEDEIDRRVLVHIAGSGCTVKRGMAELLGRITRDKRYKERSICLRRIKELSVDTAGFKKTRDAEPVNLSCCTERFAWERLTRERWRYVEEPSGGRRPKGSR